MVLIIISYTVIYVNHVLIERDLKKGIITESEAQELIDKCKIKRIIYKDIAGFLDSIIQIVPEEYEIDTSRLKVINATETITNYENPFAAIMSKPNASLVLAMKEVGNQEENYAGMITAGNSGAILMGSFRFLSDENKTRPCMAAVLPNGKGAYSCVVDTGATIDCSAGQLHSFARLGSDLMKKMYKIESPRVALLSNGAEKPLKVTT